MDKIGIYMIRNNVNNKIYIGQSIQLEKRWNEHIKALNAKSIKCNPVLLNEWNKYGQKSFEFKVLENCTFDELTDREKYYMELYNSLDRNYGYNIREAGNQGALPDYLKKQISEKVKLDRSLHPEKYSGENNGFYGKKHSEQSIKKMSEIKKGKKRSKETIEKTSISNRNNKLSGKVPSALDLDQTLEVILIGYSKTTKQIAEQFNVKIGTIECIRKGYYWACRYLFERDIDNDNFKIWKNKMIERGIFNAKNS